MGFIEIDPQNFRWVQAQLGHCREALQVRGAKTWRCVTLRHFLGGTWCIFDQENWYGCYLINARVLTMTVTVTITVTHYNYNPFLLTWFSPKNPWFFPTFNLYIYIHIRIYSLGSWYYCTGMWDCSLKGLCGMVSGGSIPQSAPLGPGGSPHQPQLSWRGIRKSMVNDVWYKVW